MTTLHLNRSESPKTRARAGLGAVAVLLALSACTDLFVTPAPPAPAGLGVTFSLAGGGSAAGGTAAAFDKANQIRVRVSRGEATVTDTVIGLRPGQEEARIRLNVEPQANEETVQLAVELRADGAALFRGTGSISIRAGATSEAPVQLTPVAAGIDLSPTSLALTSIGDSVQVGAAVTFATGDTITGAVPQWATSNANVAAVTQEGFVVARANGNATVTASLGQISSDLAVTVQQAPAAIVFNPDTTSVRVGNTITLAPIVRDARGNPITGRTVDSWTSSNPQIASVDGQGRVTGLATGSAFITAAIGQVNGIITVRVLAPLPIVETAPPAQVDSTRAVVGGSVNPRGLSTEAWIEYGTTANLGLSTTPRVVGTANATQPFSVTLTGLTPLTTYHYRLVARSVAGTVHGETRSFRTIETDTVPRAPILSAANGDSLVTLTWRRIGLPASLFRLERRVGSSGAWFEVAQVPGNATDTLYTRIDEPGGGPFTYRVRGCHSLGCGPYSNLETVTLPPRPPLVVTLDVTEITVETARLNGYIAPNGAPTTWWFELYEADIMDDPVICSGGSTLPTQADWGVSCTVSNLYPGGWYLVRLVAQNSVGTRSGEDIEFETTWDGSDAAIPGQTAGQRVRPTVRPMIVEPAATPQIRMILQQRHFGARIRR